MIKFFMFFNINKNFFSIIFFHENDKIAKIMLKRLF